ncbi:aminodeoxychorismate/anthranilate synthase component II [Clostridium bornimense]|uniref:anthranilate synthase component II n=1 Tax=Clostridium bornimense TaxID=1216932 RepID=UPI001C0F5D77|nr:aminodeoxychorismate/anthranilate synthase component II [Clostridium bornimense]MBU5316876.1 aminodeoxychorismate/anthranilate synthase component II [Clostridium bornimense]
MFLMIDNYDSFVYNLVRYFKELDVDIIVKRNDEITIDEIKNMNLEGIIISPGPKKPKDAKISLDIIYKFKDKIPILGICLGHQAICYGLGGNVVKGKTPVHGKVSKVTHNGKRLFIGLNSPFKVTRYHSLIVDEEILPEGFNIDCKSDDGVIMGISHKEYPLYGVQFHPEAVLTEYGHDILKNYIGLCKEWWQNYD